MRESLDGGSMMGARADMYMHKQAIGGVLGGIVSFLKPAAEMETYAITIGQFSKSAEEAKATLAELQEFALISPYSMESVVQGTSLMMRYGMQADDAVKMTKMLGEVSGGSSAKMELLALAVGQTTSMGKLMGQELRQMTEHGFNPLQIAAEAMLGPNADPKALKAKVLELSKLMRKGAIDAGLVTAALELSTSKGGKYAGEMAKRANSVSGLTSQIVESLKIAAAVIGKIFEEDTKKALKSVLKYVTDLIKYLRDPKNQEFIKAWGYFVIKIVAAIAAFHTLGFVLAKTVWLFGSLAKLLSFILPLFTLIRYAIMGIARTSIGPVIASFFSMYGAIIATTVVAVALGAVLAYVMYNANTDIKKYNEELKKSNELTDKLSKHHASKHVQTLLEIHTEKDPAKRKELAENALKSAQIELQGKQSQISQQEQLVASLEPTIASAYQGGRKVWEGESATLEQLKQQREALSKRVADLQGIVTPAAPGTDGMLTPDTPDWAKDPASAAAHFKTFLGAGEGEDNLPDTPAAYRSGSSEHALALYNHDVMSIGDSAAAREEAEKKQKEKEKIDLLQQIATNTKIQAGLNSVGTAAGDMVAGFLSGGKK
jgi:tape measure domain-containing protein